MSTPFQLQLPRSFHEAMLKQAIVELPNECCGILAGRLSETIQRGVSLGQVLRCYPLVNAAASPREYMADPKSLFSAHREMRQENLEVLALYHSHPTTEAVPSRTDLERNYWSGVVTLIISLQKPLPEVRGWWLTAEGFQEASWELID